MGRDPFPLVVSLLSAGRRSSVVRRSGRARQAALDLSRREPAPEMGQAHPGRAEGGRNYWLTLMTLMWAHSNKNSLRFVDNHFAIIASIAPIGDSIRPAPVPAQVLSPPLRREKQLNSVTGAVCFREKETAFEFRLSSSERSAMVGRSDAPLTNGSCHRKDNECRIINHQRLHQTHSSNFGGGGGGGGSFVASQDCRQLGRAAGAERDAAMMTDKPTARRRKVRTVRQRQPQADNRSAARSISRLVSRLLARRPPGCAARRSES